MKWSKKINAQYAYAILDELNRLSKSPLPQGQTCAGVVPCKLLYFPSTDHRCQLIQRLGAVVTNAVGTCRDLFETVSSKMTFLLQNNEKGKRGVPCDPVKWL